MNAAWLAALPWLCAYALFGVALLGRRWPMPRWLVGAGTISYSLYLFNLPVFATILSAAVLKEPVGRWRWGAVAIGFLGVLHTWGQNLLHHPHLHCLVPGGGISLDGSR